MKNLLILPVLFILIFAGCRSSSDFEDTTTAPVGESESASKVISPKVGDSWSAGDTYTIRWKNFFASSVDIILEKKKIYNRFQIANDATNTGVFNWTIPEGVPPSHHYQIKIISNDDPREYFYSEVFNIY